MKKNVHNQEKFTKTIIKKLEELGLINKNKNNVENENINENEIDHNQENNENNEQNNEDAEANIEMQSSDTEIENQFHKNKMMKWVMIVVIQK